MTEIGHTDSGKVMENIFQIMEDITREIGMQINSMAMESFDIATDVFISGNFWREIEMAPEN
jgi:hypothetical protein